MLLARNDNEASESFMFVLAGLKYPEMGHRYDDLPGRYADARSNGPNVDAILNSNVSIRNRPQGGYGVGEDDQDEDDGLMLIVLIFVYTMFGCTVPRKVEVVFDDPAVLSPPAHSLPVSQAVLMPSIFSD
ncbi:hypothetical protein N7G274_003432 [Stereocaulon virgatum]|uniref:Uncharacterized protein n=1 Tax=Stereocaulon virgatum TaxID=373712 RepID=A0ABR4ADL5_9LECA